MCKAHLVHSMIPLYLENYHIQLDKHSPLRPPEVYTCHGRLVSLCIQQHIAGNMLPSNKLPGVNAALRAPALTKPKL